jgi:hypothetical protein
VSAFANVDQTSMVRYSYSCYAATGWLLHAEFNLWGHHYYYRDYQINLPGVIEIADASHDTLAKSKNVSIDGCNFSVWSCTISSTGSWGHKFGFDVTSFVLDITTNLPILQSGDTISIDGSGVNSGETLQIYDGSTFYDFAWQVVSIEMQNDKIVMQNDSNRDTLISFTNKVYDGQDQYVYSVSPDKKNIELIKRSFQRTNTGSQMSSANPWDEFAAVNGMNIGGTDSALSWTRSTQWPWYVSWLDYWQYTQPNFTTTKVKVYPTSLSCTELEDSNGASIITTLPFVGTLAGITQSYFTWNTMKVNTWAAEAMFANTSISITGINYQTVWEVAGVKDKVNEITLWFREGTGGVYSADTKWVSSVTLPTSISTPGLLPFLAFQLKEKTATCEKWDEMGCTVPTLVPTWEYILLIQFFNSWSRIGDLEVRGFDIKPNNNYTKSGSLVVTTSWSGYANNSDSYTLCQDYHDSYTNNYTTNTGITTNLSGGGWYIDQIMNTWEWVKIFDSIFQNSKLCFSVLSISPWSKNITFTSRLPIFDINNVFTGFTPWISSPSTSIVFKKPITAVLKASNSLAEDYTGMPQVWTMQKYLLALSNSGNLLGFTDGAINVSTDSIINTQTWHLFEEFSADSDFGSSTTNYVWFTTRINATGWFLAAPQLTSTGLWISYTLSGNLVRYLINESVDPTSTSVISSTGVSIDTSLGVKIIGNSQLSWKAEIAGQKSNLSAVSTVEQRNEMRKNATILTRNMISWQVVNGVKYIKWSGSVTLSWDQTFETLVVQNGNVILSGDINPSGKELWIIVLAGDDYVGDIYVVPSVRYINALMYGDGWFISVKDPTDLVSFRTDSAERTNTLNQQLVIKGILFTRNTIWWSLDPDPSWNYKLPGDSLTTNFNEAMIYDLDQIRRSNYGWDTQLDKNQNNDDYFVIIYDSKYLQSPPAGFNIQF